MVAWLSLPQMILYTALYLLSQWLMPHITPQMLADFKANMEKILGAGRCHVLSIRPEGGAVL